MKKELCGVIDLKPSMKCEQSVIIEYYLLECDFTDEDYDETKPYGIEVMKKQMIDGIVYREIKTVKYMSDNCEYIKGLLKLMKDNSVTPVTVADILEDMAVNN
ncbi:MAG: DUF6514 family protein [Clostridia bacterium]|nr:DUF6514 family protein [Clostridia bacterium]